MPASAPRSHPLLLRRDDVHRHHRQHRAVHGHRHRHPIERDPVEQDLHVLDRVDGDTRLPHVAGDPRVIGVIATVGREVERDGQPRLSRFQVASIERVRRLGRREARVLPERPGPTGVHRRPGTSDERSEARQRIEMLQTFEVGSGIERLHVETFRSLPREIRGSVPPGFLLDERRPRFQFLLIPTGHRPPPARAGAASASIPPRVRRSSNPANAGSHEPAMAGGG